MLSIPGEAAYVGIGSNIGDKGANCLEAIKGTAGDERARILAVSSLYVTTPVSAVVQDDFVNCVLAIAWRDSPLSLLEHLRHIENRMGRVRQGIRDGPRIIDLDILLFGNVVFSDAVLTIPHPRLHERKFALLPCLEINKELVHPVLKKPLAALITDIGPEQEIRLQRRVDLCDITTYDRKSLTRKGGL